MSFFRRCGLLVSAVLAFSGAPLSAQENVEAGKTPAQLYASDCAICHKSPQGLSKAGGLFGLQSFLREHYTASRETAAVIAKYLKAIDKAAPPVARKRTAAHHSKKTEKSGDDKGKTESGEGARKKSASTGKSAAPAGQDKAADGAVHAEKPPAEKPAAKESDKPAKPD
ncbi:MAG TPA: hypothetical protein VFL51_17380 [Pseudolabrys sp.]|nr:hypothetical protein [Pseudolabrys sp.]